MDISLRLKEIDNIIDSEWWIDYKTNTREVAIAKAQLKKVVEWIERSSSPHYILGEDDVPRPTGGRIIPDFNWETLQKEVEK